MFTCKELTYKTDQREIRIFGHEENSLNFISCANDGSAINVFIHEETAEYAKNHIPDIQIFSPECFSANLSGTHTVLDNS